MHFLFPRGLQRAVLAFACVSALLTGCSSDKKITDAVAPSPLAASVNTPAPPSLDGIALAPPNARAVAVSSAPTAWGGERTDAQATLSDRVVQYDIAATLDPIKHTIAGNEKLTWRNRSNVPVRSIYVHLYLNAFEGSGSTFYTERKTRGFTFRSDVETEDGDWGHIELKSVSQGGAAVPWYFVHPDEGPDTDHTVVRMDLPTAVAPGKSTTLDIGFFNQLPRVVARTGYFGTFHLVGQWFPKIAVLELPGERGATQPRWNAHEMHLHSEFYADFGSYDVKITVPKGYTVGATGEETSPATEKDGQITHRFVQNDVHDFAWTADNRTAPVVEGTYNGAGSPVVTVKVLFPPEYADNAQPALKAAIDSLAYFSQTLGPYPYKTLTVVIPPFNAGEAGGMEYPTFITADSVKDLKPDTTGSYLLDFVTIHEFGHGYFYGILASNEFEEPMLDEGLNQYWDLRMLRERGQAIHPIPLALRKLGMDLKLDVFSIERAGADIREPSDAVGNNSWDRYSSRGYSSVYSRTATTMHDLEERLGKDATEKAFTAYSKRWKFRHPSIADLRDVLIEVSGKRDVVETVFAQQVYNATRVDDRIEKFTSIEELPQAGTANVNGSWVEETEKQVKKRISALRKEFKKAHPDAAKDSGPFAYRTTVNLRRRGAPMPQELVVKFADGSTETVPWDNTSRWERFSWVKPVKAISAELDGKRQNFLDFSKIDDSSTIEADRSASTRWSTQIAALAQLILSLVVTL